MYESIFAITVLNERLQNVKVLNESIMQPYFSREQALAALFFLNLETEFDVEAIVTTVQPNSGPVADFRSNEGMSARAGAVRLAIARAMSSFVSTEWQEKMRLAGLLTRDPRRAERKKVGKHKARKAHTW